jgi:hypothetical protein
VLPGNGVVQGEWHGWIVDLRHQAVFASMSRPIAYQTG